MGTFGSGRWAVSHAGNEFVLDEGLLTKALREMIENGEIYSQYIAKR